MPQSLAQVHIHVIFSKITEVREYISDQMNHHKKMSFQEE